MIAIVWGLLVSMGATRSPPREVSVNLSEHPLKPESRLKAGFAFTRLWFVLPYVGTLLSCRISANRKLAVGGQGGGPPSECAFVHAELWIAPADSSKSTTRKGRNYFPQPRLNEAARAADASRAWKWRW
jgi:hypothetical protein